MPWTAPPSRCGSKSEAIALRLLGACLGLVLLVVAGALMWVHLGVQARAWLAR